MAVDSLAPAGPVMILACAGGSNVGQLTNQAAVELTQEGFGKMSCLAGVGGELPGFVEAAMEAPGIVVMDGCPVGCAKAIFEKAEVPLRGYMVLTDLGIVKNKDLSPKREELEQVKAAVRQAARGL